MKKLFVFVLCMTGLLGCSGDGQNFGRIPDGIYAGTFKREIVWGENDTANITLTFSSGTWSGYSDRDKYPALCSGTYTSFGDIIVFENECIWTAEFDQSLILSGKYVLTSSGSRLEFYRDYRSATADTYIDRYILKKAE